MNTKMDFKIETLLEKYEEIGFGRMITTPCQIGEWWVMPYEDYQGNIPSDIQEKKIEFLTSCVPFSGLLIAEDIRVIEAKREQEKKKIEEENRQKGSNQQSSATGLGILSTVLFGLFFGALYLISAAIAYDPMLIAVLPDGRWICLGTWYD